MAKEEDKKIVIDRRFSPPPGVTDVTLADEDEKPGYSAFESDEPVAVAGLTTTEIADAQAQSTNFTPVTSLSIVSQTVRITETGGSVVDVVLSIDGVNESQYEVDIRVSKK